MRQDFWTDEKLGRMTDAVRLFYIGLWCVADDLGWMRWDPARIGALLYPFRGGKRRERDVNTWSDALSESGRLVLHPCGCAEIPTLERHQVIGGKKSKGEYERHLRACGPDSPGSPDSPPGRVSNGKERNVTVTRAPESPARDIWQERVDQTQAAAKSA